MGMMSVEHPDILKFLYAKQNLEAFTNFNISVKITESWMKKVLKSGKTLHIVKNPRTGMRYLLPRRIDMANYTISDLYELPGRSKPVSKGADSFYTVSDVWKMIVNCAHKTGEPGIAFIDRINRDNPTPSLGQIEATNPCGEQPLLPYEACTLGSINVSKFVSFGGTSTVMDWPALAETVKLAVRFLDNIIDVCDYPVKDTIRLAHGNRKIGLGIMGFADCLFTLGIPYDSNQGIEFGAELMKFVNDKSHEASAELAGLRGHFPNFNSSIWQTGEDQEIRNASITCIAPTGTISIIADCSSGIEPVYSLVFLRQVLDGSKLLQIDPVFKQMAEKRGIYSKKLEKQIARTGSIQKMTAIPADMRRIFRGAYDIEPRWHIRMQAAFQQHCDAAVSKTINFSEKATVSDVDKAYKLAYRLGCKGVTVYRQHSRKYQPMSLY
jgi:ribonucleoside-diphosphate reductase alpha chain